LPGHGQPGPALALHLSEQVLVSFCLGQKITYVYHSILPSKVAS
jgi:hypothetical protein